MGWSDVDLCIDADLSALEPGMPEEGRAFRSRSDRNAFNGKRGVAKELIEGYLRARGLNPDGLTRVSQLRQVAASLELSLIYQAMTLREDSPEGEKAERYRALSDRLLDGLVLDYEEPVASKPPRVLASARLMRQ